MEQSGAEKLEEILAAAEGPVVEVNVNKVILIKEEEEEKEKKCRPADARDEDGEDGKEKIGDQDKKRLAGGEKEEESVYGYLQQGFTSELCKIELKNVPQHVSYADLKKMIEKTCGLKAHKIKIICKHPKYAYVSFNNEEERDKAIGILDGHKWRKNTLKAKKALPMMDPLLAKRKSEGTTSEDPLLKKCKSEGVENLSEQELGDMINDKICPLWRTPYDEQLKTKYEKYHRFLSELRRDILRIKEVQDGTSVAKFLQEAAEKNDRLICPLQEIRPSPVTTGYRNKCEFSIGPDKVVGFRLGLYREGSTTVIRPPKYCPIVSEKMFAIISLFQEFLQNSPLKGYNNVTRQGHWRQLTVRTTSLGSLIIIAVHPQDLSEESLLQLKSELRDFFAEKRSECSVDSIFFHPFETRDKLLHDRTELECLAGEEFIKESMRDGSLQLKISPFAFFQTSTRGAEVCYDAIASLANLTVESVVLDVCCGIGPIGLYVADKVKKVIGIELNEDAVRDARYNAEINGIKNAIFHEGKAEKLIDCVIQGCIKTHGSKVDLVAIIDPPRAGLNSSLIKSLRATTALKRLIYVSCEPSIAKSNLIDLCRPTSNAFKGPPFVPTQAIPVDMFPHTSHCELLLLYERLDIVKSREETALSVEISSS